MLVLHRSPVGYHDDDNDFDDVIIMMMRSSMINMIMMMLDMIEGLLNGDAYYQENEELENKKYFLHIFSVCSISPTESWIVILFT